MKHQDPTLDRRIRRTHKLLSDALIELTLKHGYDTLTIRDITDHADVAYATFFRHFDDKNDLLLLTVNTLIETIEGLNYKPQSIEHMYYEGVSIFKHVKTHSDLYRLLLASQGAHHILEQLKHSIATSMLTDCIPYIKDSLGHLPYSLVTYQHASSIITLVSWWLAEDMKTPPEKMAIYYFDIAVAPYFDVEADADFVLDRDAMSPLQSSR